MNEVFSLQGFTIHINQHHPKEYKQVKFPRSKKKRIRKKWEKNPKYYSLVDKNIFYIDELNARIYVSTKMFEKIKSQNLQ